MNMSNLIVNTRYENTVNPNIESSVVEFKTFAKKTAESILEMGRVVYEAKRKFKNNREDFEMFSERIGFKPASSSIKKLTQIGKSYMTLKERSKYLPNNWTTLYLIARLTSEQLQEFIDQGLIHQHVLGAQIEALLKPLAGEDLEEIPQQEVKRESPPKLELNGNTFLCEIGDLGDVSLKAQIQLLINSLKQLKVKVNLAPDLKKALKTEPLTMA